MKCPSCNKELEKHYDETGHEYNPRPGDLGICFYCGCKTIVGKNHTLNLLTPESILRLTPMERVQHQRMWEAWSQQYGMKAS